MEIKIRHKYSVHVIDIIRDMEEVVTFNSADEVFEYIHFYSDVGVYFKVYCDDELINIV